MIAHRCSATAERVYRLQAEREEMRRAHREIGTEEECDRSNEQSMKLDIEYVRALEAHFIDAEFLLRPATKERAA